jgi:hypothetical protein
LVPAQGSSIVIEDSIFPQVLNSERKGLVVLTLTCFTYRQLTRADVIFVQADLGDGPAIALYESLGTKETAHHFEIDVCLTGERLVVAPPN